MCSLAPPCCNETVSTDRVQTFHRTWRLCTTVTRPCHRSITWAIWIQTTSSHPTSLRYILILSSHLCLGLPSHLLDTRFPHKVILNFLTSPHFIHALYVLSPLFDQQWKVQIMECIIMPFCLASHYFTCNIQAQFNSYITNQPPNYWKYVANVSPVNVVEITVIWRRATWEDRLHWCCI
jgi:hypothetical protein